MHSSQRDSRPIDGGAKGQSEKRVFEYLIQVPAVVGSEERRNKFFLVESNLSANEREELARFLRKNINVFAWQSYDMPGIDDKVMCHKLYISPNFKPIKQKPRRSTPKKARAIKEEV